MKLYHGGVAGLRPGDVIEPHETKRFDDCPTCQAGGDASHLPDRVFATPVRLYAKHFASKWGHGWLYSVEAVGELVRSEMDSFESYHAAMFRVVGVCEREVLLTMSERRRLMRLWTEADKSAGVYTPDPLFDLAWSQIVGGAV